MTHYGLSSRKRPPPISDDLGLTFWVVAYGMPDAPGLLRVTELPKVVCILYLEAVKLVEIVCSWDLYNVITPNNNNKKVK